MQRSINLIGSHPNLVCYLYTATREDSFILTHYPNGYIQVSGHTSLDARIPQFDRPTPDLLEMKARCRLLMEGW